MWPQNSLSTRVTSRPPACRRPAPRSGTSISSLFLPDLASCKTRSGPLSKLALLIRLVGRTELSSGNRGPEPAKVVKNDCLDELPLTHVYFLRSWTSLCTRTASIAGSRFRSTIGHRPLPWTRLRSRRHHRFECHALGCSHLRGMESATAATRRASAAGR